MYCQRDAGDEWLLVSKQERALRMGEDGAASPCGSYNWLRLLTYWALSSFRYDEASTSAEARQVMGLKSDQQRMDGFSTAKEKKVTWLSLTESTMQCRAGTLKECTLYE